MSNDRAKEEGKLLGELRVNELRAELDKRGINNNGVKVVLSVRLNKALLDEGLDPTTHRFFLNDGSPTKTAKVKEEKEEKVESKMDNGNLSNGDNEEQKQNNEQTKNENDNENKQEEEVVAGKQDEGEGDKVEANIEENKVVVDEVETKDEPESTSLDVEEKKSEVVEEDKNKQQRKCEKQDDFEGVKDNKTTKFEEEMLEDPLNECDESVKNKVDTKTSTATTTTNNSNKDDLQRSLWLRGLTTDTSAASLKQMCMKYGKVQKAKIFNSKSRRSNEPTACFGFVTFTEQSMAEKCLAEMAAVELNGKKLMIERATESTLFDMAAKQQSSTQKVAAPKAKRQQIEAPKDEEREKARRERKPIVYKASPTRSSSVTSSSAAASISRPVVRRIPEKRDIRAKHISSSSSSMRHNESLIIRARVDPPPRGSSIRSVERGISISTSSLRQKKHDSPPRSRRSRSRERSRDRHRSRDRIDDVLRRKEEEYRKREIELELAKEKERIKFEKERLVRERLELELQKQKLELEKAAMGGAGYNSAGVSSSRYKDDRRRDERSRDDRSRDDRSRDDRSRDDRSRDDRNRDDRRRVDRDRDDRKDSRKRTRRTPSPPRKKEHYSKEPTRLPNYGISATGWSRPEQYFPAPPPQQPASYEAPPTWNGLNSNGQVDVGVGASWGSNTTPAKPGLYKNNSGGAPWQQNSFDYRGY